MFIISELLRKVSHKHTMPRFGTKITDSLSLQWSLWTTPLIFQTPQLTGTIWPQCRFGGGGAPRDCLRPASSLPWPWSKCQSPDSGGLGWPWCHGRGGGGGPFTKLPWVGGMMVACCEVVEECGHWDVVDTDVRWEASEDFLVLLLVLCLIDSELITAGSIPTPLTL